MARACHDPAWRDMPFLPRPSGAPQARSDGSTRDRYCKRGAGIGARDRGKETPGAVTSTDAAAPVCRLRGHRSAAGGRPDAAGMGEA